MACGNADITADLLVTTDSDQAGPSIMSALITEDPQLAKDQIISCIIPLAQVTHEVAYQKVMTKLKNTCKDSIEMLILAMSILEALADEEVCLDSIHLSSEQIENRSLSGINIPGKSRLMRAARDLFYDWQQRHPEYTFHGYL